MSTNKPTESNKDQTSPAAAAANPAAASTAAAINHAVTIPSKDNKPDPTGTPTKEGEPSPTTDNPWLCAYTCTITGDTINLLWDGTSFTLTDAEANDPTFGTVDFNYNPPLTA